MKSITMKWCSILCIITTLASISITHAASTTTTTATTVGANQTSAPMPEYLPIDSIGALQAYAISSAKEGSMNLYGDKLIAFNGEVRSVYVSGRNANDVIKVLTSSTGFKVRTTDTTKPVYVFGRVSNADGHELFQSNWEIVNTKVNGGGLEITNTKLTYKLAWQVPLPKIEGVTSAHVQYEDESGQQWTQELFVSDGAVFLPPNYASKKGTLVVARNTQNGYEQFAYNLGTGMNIPGTNIGGIVASAIENNLTASDKGLATSALLTVTGTMTPAPKNNWSTYSPPTATINITTGAGNNRTCTAVFKIPTVTSNPNTELDGITAFAQDPEHTDANNTFEELPAVSVSKVRNGSEYLVTVTWSLHNNADAVDGTNWYCYLVIPVYEAFQKPQQPYYSDKG